VLICALAVTIATFREIAVGKDSALREIVPKPVVVRTARVAFARQNLSSLAVSTRGSATVIQAGVAWQTIGFN
jgi:hypothetical protein